MSSIDPLLGVGLGLGLAAACGFRVFVPLFAISLGALTGHIPLSHGFAWIGTIPAAIAFGTATTARDRCLLHPLVRSPARYHCDPSRGRGRHGRQRIGHGGSSASPQVGCGADRRRGAAGLLQGATVLLRLKSLAATGGAANALVSTVELSVRPAPSFSRSCCPSCAWRSRSFSASGCSARRSHIVFGRKAAEAAASDGT